TRKRIAKPVKSNKVIWIERYDLARCGRVWDKSARNRFTQTCNSRPGQRGHRHSVLDFTYVPLRRQVRLVHDEERIPVGKCRVRPDRRCTRVEDPEDEIGSLER